MIGVRVIVLPASLVKMVGVVAEVRAAVTVVVAVAVHILGHGLLWKAFHSHVRKLGG